MLIILKKQSAGFVLDSFLLKQSKMKSNLYFTQLLKMNAMKHSGILEQANSKKQLGLSKHRLPLSNLTKHIQFTNI